jgi:hypothetical protein
VACLEQNPASLGPVHLLRLLHLLCVHVSGVAVLLDSRALSNAQIRRIEVTDLWQVGKEDMYGYGLVNVQAAVGR